jgi:hypothetical protein
MKTPVLRIGRLCGDFDPVLRFYRDGLGLNILAEFRKHAGFDGIVLGKHGAPYHLEFTRMSDASSGRVSIKDDLLVFYLPEPSAWLTAVQRMRAAGFAPVPSLNPYWEWEGVTFEDPEGNRVTLYNAFWDG